MRHAETEGFTWHRRWTTPDYLRLLVLATAIAYGGLRAMGQV
jgi:hypothetical protein